MRHGQTEYNRLGLRCGGDIDIPLTAAGEAQARCAATELTDLDIDIIIASPLTRTRRTAEIVRAGLGRPVSISLHPGLIERRLGSWNGQPVAATEADLAAGLTPPGGEAEADFRVRVADAVAGILATAYRRPLLVGSKGVARIIDLALADGRRPPAENAAILRFFAPLGRLESFIQDNRQ
jgi:probable phosphoglycerate mutase